MQPGADGPSIAKPYVLPIRTYLRARAPPYEDAFEYINEESFHLINDMTKIN